MYDFAIYTFPENLIESGGKMKATREVAISYG